MSAEAKVTTNHDEIRKWVEVSAAKKRSAASRSRSAKKAAKTRKK